MTQNLFFTLSGLAGLVLLFLSLGRQMSYRFESGAVTVLQYGLAAEAILLFHYGLLWTVVNG